MRDMESLQKVCAVRRGKEIDVKGAETLFEMKEYDFFVMC